MSSSSRLPHRAADGRSIAEQYERSRAPNRDLASAHPEARRDDPAGRSADTDLTSIREARDCLRRATEAQRVFARFSQREVDAVVRSMSEGAVGAARRTASLAHEETGYGVVDDKVLKNLFCSAVVHDSIRDLPTVGVLDELSSGELVVIAEPKGVIAALVPATNPTSTIFFKALIAVKAGNAIVFSPHPRGRRSGVEATRVVSEAAVAAGAPEGLIQCLEHVTLRGTQELMQHRLCSLILATGGIDMVRAASSTGKPTIAVGPGNCPAYIDRSVADPIEAVEMIMAGKTFDHSTACASEQTIVVDESVSPTVREALSDLGAHFLTPDESRALGAVLITPEGKPAPDTVGQSPQRLAEHARISVPAETRLLVAELGGVGPEHPLSREKLAPVLGYCEVASRDEAWTRCNELLRFGGDGHSFVVHAEDPAVIARFARSRSYRILVNQPALFGAMGYSAALEPSFMLGTGSWGGTAVADNISARHLLDLKRVCLPTRDWRGGRTAIASRAGSHVTPAEPQQSAAVGAHEEAVEQIVRDVMARLFPNGVPERLDR